MWKTGRPTGLATNDDAPTGNYGAKGTSRRAIILTGVLLVYGLVLIGIWGMRKVWEHSSGPFTTTQIRNRSESICALFNAPSEAERWDMTITEVYEGNRIPRRIWSVDCSGPVNTQGHAQGAVVQWDADSGELYAVTNVGVNWEERHSPTATRLNATEITRDAQKWWERLGLQEALDSGKPAKSANAAEPWVLDGPPKQGRSAWHVRWRKRDRTCLMQIVGDTGDLALLWIKERPRAQPGTP
jgi:hypothetical protein